MLENPCSRIGDAQLSALCLADGKDVAGEKELSKPKGPT